MSSTKSASSASGRTPGDPQLAGLADLYNDDPRFRACFDKLSPKLAEFMRRAVKVYVERGGKK